MTMETDGTTEDRIFQDTLLLNWDSSRFQQYACTKPRESFLVAAQKRMLLFHHIHSGTGPAWENGSSWQI